MNCINFNLYVKENNKNILKKNLELNLEFTIDEIRNKILKELFDEKSYNSVILNNITERIYKDYGLLFFDKGILLNTFDHFKLEKFSIPDRTFDFLVEPCNKNKDKEIKYNNKNVYNRKESYDPNKRFNINYEEKDEPQKNFVFHEEDFPPLC